MDKQNNPTAFPCKRSLTSAERQAGASGLNFVEEVGLSMRDYFAAKAMQGELCAHVNNRPEDLNDIASFAYRIADAMLRARSEG